MILFLLFNHYQLLQWRKGLPLKAHAILFEHANFHGAHKHVFWPETDPNAANDNFFNDKISSVIILRGNWAFYRDSGFTSQYPNIFNSWHVLLCWRFWCCQ